MKKLLLVLFVVYTTGIGTFSLIDEDEGGYFRTVKEMNARQEWVIPYLGGEVIGDKPIFQYWVGKAVSLLFGEKILGLRLAVVLFALGTLLVTANMERYLFGKSGCSALILGTSIMFVFLSRIFIPDTFFVFFGTLGLAFFVRGWKLKKTWFVAYCASLACAVLAKGPLGVAIPMSIVGAFFMTLSKDEQKRLLPTWAEGFAGVAAFAAICLPWYVLVTLRTEGTFLYDFLIIHHWHRFSNVMQGHGGTPLRYLVYLFFGFLPWSVWLFVRSNERVRTLWERPESRLLLIWIGIWAVLLSISRTKLPGYLLPTFPAFAMLLSRRFENALPLAWFSWAARGFAALVLAGLACVFYWGAWNGSLRATEGLVPLFALSSLVLVLTGLVLRFTSVARIRVAGVEAILTALLIPVLVPSTLEAHRVPVQLGAVLKDRVAPDAVVACYDFCPPSLTHYAGRQVVRLREKEHVGQLLAESPKLYLVCYASTALDLPTTLQEIGRFPELPLAGDVVVLASR